MSAALTAAQTALALDGRAVLPLIADGVESWAGVRPRSCRATILKRRERRLVVRYDLETLRGPVALVGKWFSNERGAAVADLLRALRGRGFAGPGPAVPAPVAYLPEARALFTEAVEGPLLWKVLPSDPAAAASAGAWLARFHAAGLSLERECGPRKQVHKLEGWLREAPPLRPLGSRLAPEVAALPDPGLPVHFDFQPSQALVAPRGGLAVVDFDQAGFGDPAYDAAHFLARLETRALRYLGGPEALAPAAAAFREGYAARAPFPEAPPALGAFAWLVEAHIRFRKGGVEREWQYALTRAERCLEA